MHPKNRTTILWTIIDFSHLYCKTIFVIRYQYQARPYKAADTFSVERRRLVVASSRIVGAVR